MISVFSRLLVFALASIIALPSYAQSPDDGGKVSIRYVAQVAPKGLGKLVMVGEEDLRSEPFDLPVNFLSDPIESPGRAFTLKTETKMVTLAKVALPADGRSFVVLLVPAEKSGFEPVVIRDAGGSFRPGDFYLYNVSSLGVEGRVGTTVFSIPRRSGKVIRPKGVREKRFYDVLLGVKEKSVKRVISSSRWPFQPQVRSYVFFFDDPVRKDVSFRAVDEFVPPEEKPDGS